MTPNQVQFLSGIADNFLRQVLVGQKHVQKVPQWYGETVGFWDGDTLVAWTANVQGWTLVALDVRVQQQDAGDRGVHARRRRQGHHRRRDVLRSRGVHAAATTVAPWNRVGGIDDPERRFTFVECRVQSTIVGRRRRRVTQLNPLDEGYIDYSAGRGRQNWESNSSRVGSIRASRALGRSRNRRSRALHRLGHRTDRVRAR